MHGEEPVEYLGRDKMIVGYSKLNPHQKRFESTNDKKEERVADVH